MNELIYNRTLADVNNRTWKGYYNASDLNRVESWCRYLADELNAVGYNINITTKTNWSQTDMRTASEMERIRTNIKAIMTGFHYITTIYANANDFNFVKANNWEKILDEIYHLLWGMENWYVHSGVSNSGQNRLWQHRFRQNFSVPTITSQPPLYTPLYYIGSNGGAWCYTNVVGKVGTKVEMDIMFTEITANKRYYFWGNNITNTPRFALRYLLQRWLGTYDKCRGRLFNNIFCST
jgi:hypothetical protein